MGLLFDILFGSDTNKTPSSKPADTWFHDNEAYEDYYKDCHDDAMAGDSDARAEMEEEFGDDWEDEY